VAQTDQSITFVIERTAFKNKKTDLRTEEERQMHPRDTLAHFILAVVVVLGLTLLMVCGDAQARIAFMSHRDGNWEIYVMDADGNNQRNLTNNPDDDQSPAWSPDGKRIAFVFERKDRNWTRQIYVMDADGDNRRNLSINDFDEWAPSWSPNGKRIAFVSNRDDGGGSYSIYVMNSNRGNRRRVTDNRDDVRSPSWSPNGERITFSSDRDGNWEIYVIDVDGDNQRRLTNNPSDDLSPSWSPDGKQIAFMSDRDGHFMNGWSTSEIYVMDTDGRNPQNLTNNRHADYSPAWVDSPFSVFPASKQFTIWGWLKRTNR